jgi:hypothetical protein
VFLLEDGVVRSALVEVLESAIEMPQRLLERYAGDIKQPPVLLPLLEGREQGRGLTIADMLLLLVVGISPQAQGPVVDETNAAKGAGQQMLLLVGWIKTVSVGSSLSSLHVSIFFFSAKKAATHSEEGSMP